MSPTRKNSLKNLKAALSESSKTANSSDLNAFKRLCAAYISTGDQKQRERALGKVLRQETGLSEMLRQNDDVVTALIERALTELAVGCTVTETRIRTGSGGKTVETVTRQLPPNQSAAEFLLINKAPDRYSHSPSGKSEDGEGRIGEILEALKNVR